jgi:hypothetical protein
VAVVTVASACVFGDDPGGAPPTTPDVVGAPSVRSVSSGTKAAVSGVHTTLSLAAPSGLTAGDVVVAVVTNNGGQYNSVATPMGWQELPALDLWEGNTGARTHVFYKTAGSADSGPFAFAATGSVDLAGALYAIEHPDPSAPIAASAGQVHGTSTSCSAPSITAPASSLLRFDCSIAPVETITGPSCSWRLIDKCGLRRGDG